MQALIARKHFTNSGIQLLFASTCFKREHKLDPVYGQLSEVLTPTPLMRKVNTVRLVTKPQIKLRCKMWFIRPNTVIRNNAGPDTTLAFLTFFYSSNLQYNYFIMNNINNQNVFNAP